MEKWITAHLDPGGVSQPFSFTYGGRQSGDLMPGWKQRRESSKLDAERTRRLVGAIADVGAQVFASTTDRAHLAALPGDLTRWVAVDAGRFQAG